ncbi:MAG: helix-turn-helix domain-containing protein [Fimbriiglobus sp.]
MVGEPGGIGDGADRAETRTDKAGDPLPDIGVVYTTGVVAKMLRVAPRTVNKWFDIGLLPGYRLPGMKDRRIRRADLVRFMKTHDMETSDVYARVLVCGLPAGTGSPAGGAWQIDRADSAVGFYRAVATAVYRVVVVGVGAGAGGIGDLGPDFVLAAGRDVAADCPAAVLVAAVPDDADPDRYRAAGYGMVVLASECPAGWLAALLATVPPRAAANRRRSPTGSKSTAGGRKKATTSNPGPE